MPLPAADRVESLRVLFEFLRSTDYRWEPLTPDELLRQRRAPESYSAIHRTFGLGLEPTPALLAEGVSASLLAALQSRGPLPVVSRLAELFVLHDPWPPRAGQAAHYAHFGPESLHLAEYARSRIARGGPGGKVLDLGCASGGLTLQWLEYQPQCQLLGFDLSEGAVELGRAAAQAQGIPTEKLALFAQALGPTTRIAAAQEADLVLFNPPMVHPEPGVVWPHRDGGRYGIELPLLFFRFAAQHLRPGGQLICLVTNPIVHGRGRFFDELKKQVAWRILDRQLLTPVFNQAAARKRHHADDSIQNIELWAIHAQLNA